jgi:putative protein-disulfide isomerase
MQKNEIIYIYDALCGWCYGFSPVMLSLHEKYKTEMDFTVLSGGMVLGDRAGEIGKVAPYIKSAYKVVEERAGVTFGAPFLQVLEEGAAIFSSEKPGIAMTVFKKQRNEHAVHFAHDLQSAVYSDGLDLSDFEAFGALAQKYGIDETAFISEMKTEDVRYETHQEFQTVQNWGISGFPTVLLKTKDGQYFMIAKGFTPFEQIAEVIQKIV